MPWRAALAVTAATLTFAAAACGSDDDSSDSTTATSAASATTAAGATDTASGGSGAATGVAAFCEAELAAESAVTSDPAAAGPLFEAMVAAAPDDLKETAQAVVDNAEAGPGSPEFDEPYGELIGFMKENCGFNELEVEGADYTFTGIPADVPAGPTIITFNNVGEEVHVIDMVRINDDVTETVQELLELPEEEAFSKVTSIAGVFAMPGSTSYAVADLTAGSYAALCPIPQGTTPEVMEQMSGGGGAPSGSAPEGTEGGEPGATDGSTPEGSSPGAEMPPHFALGMIQEFAVT